MQNQQRGFTLIELLITLAIAALVLSVVGSRVGILMDRSRYLETIRNVNTLLKAGKTAAIQSGSDVYFKFNFSEKSLSFGGLKPQQIQFPDFLQVKVESEGGPVFVFRPDGTAYGGRLVVVNGAVGVSFQLNWALGLVEQTDVINPT